MPPRKTLVLDLDSTLYPSTLGMERKIVPAIKRAASRRLGVTFVPRGPRFDDSVRNLHTAWTYGMTCVLTANGLEDEPPVLGEPPPRPLPPPSAVFQNHRVPNLASLRLSLPKNTVRRLRVYALS